MGRKVVPEIVKINIVQGLQCYQMENEVLFHELSLGLIGGRRLRGQSEIGMDNLSFSRLEA